MLHLWLIPVSVVLCIIIISLFHPQIMDPYVTYTHTATLISKRNSIPHQNVIDYRGHTHDTVYVTDIMAGNGGIIPPIDEDDTGNECSNHIQVVPENREGFWYDMNRLDDSNWYSGKLDNQFKSMLDKENHQRNNLIKSNIKNSSSRSTIEGFGNHRAPEYWNEKDYPILTSNGLDLTSSFPQDGGTGSNIYKSSNVKRLWGLFDDPIQRSDMEENLKSSTVIDHTEKQ
jgi:hypothetical protein